MKILFSVGSFGFLRNFEPALRLLPGGVGGPAYRAALARECQYFNAHPYLAAIAVGAAVTVTVGPLVFNDAASRATLPTNGGPFDAQTTLKD